MHLKFGQRFYAPDDGKGAGGAGGEGDKGKQVDLEELLAVKKQNADLMARLEKLEKGAPPKKDEGDKDLDDKAAAARDADAKKNSDLKAMETALKFHMNSPNFLKENEALLGSEIKDIFTQADKETFDSAIAKEQAIKASMIKTFFKLQAHMDLLTSSMKTKLEDYLKLTQNGKQEKALEMYDVVFEPAFQMLKQVKKAEALKNGNGAQGNAETQSAYEKNMYAHSRKRFLGEKHGS
jgi:hypothetical protein